ncbi:DUF3846 domain-containing protein [Corynebacterium sp. ACRPE]|uniref:DUF3846 domain-containing protein n=1 Tax=Corynebacterium sp. ACRPE TaxID=2918196 RepID=UPI001EF5BCEE|nr:DUF3846 domain-containing protein [Corynebacterium sp. ACRPE]MCG7467248.1 DUF3846 domain-containing protein [Corynebacterium sp. ACRPE]
MSLQAIKVSPDGTHTIIDFAEGEDSFLSTALDGGYVEPLRFTHQDSTIIAWMDEEGMLKKLPANPAATTIVETLTHHKLNALLVGTVVFTGDNPPHIGSLPEDAHQEILAILNA